MSLARAFTTRRAKSGDLKDGKEGSIPRSHSTKNAPMPGLRHKISAPMALTHTTNPLVYNAPDLKKKASALSATSSRSSDDEFEGPRSTGSSPPTSPDIASSNDKTSSPEPNHLSCYFIVPGQKIPADVSSVPQIPMRHAKRPSIDNMTKRMPPSTTKSSMENLAQHHAARTSNGSNHTLSSKASSTFSSRSSAATSVSSVASGNYTTMKSSAATPPSMPTIPSESIASLPARNQPPPPRRPEPMATTHPFGKELAQVSEIAERFGVGEKLHVIDEEELLLLSQGLFKLRAEDYLAEVEMLFQTFYEPQQIISAKQPQSSQALPVWI